MKEAERRRLEAAGFAIGTPQDVFGLPDDAWELAQARSDLLFAVKSRREKAGMSQADLAERMGVSQARVSRIENGAIGISTDVLLKAYFATGGKWADIGTIVRGNKAKRRTVKNPS